ncbi:MAG: FlgD immunoglobulin-like domain containing protein [Candidatus Zhuqueibacterota bacterium]
MKNFFMMFTALLVLAIGLQLEPAVAGTEHTAYGQIFNSNGSTPGNNDITFIAFIKGRPNETQTHNSTGSDYSGGWWNVACGDFPTAWQVGDVLQVDVTNTANGETGTAEVTLTSAGSDGASALHLEFIVPVELVSFDAAANDGKVNLTWSTATESNNFGFEIQRKSQTHEYDKIGFVPGNGTTAAPQRYNFSDGNVTSGTYYYRLRQIDQDGSFEISSEKMVVIAAPAEFMLEKNYPNPFNPETTINYKIGNGLVGVTDVQLNIYNSLGELVRTLFIGKQTAGQYSATWDGRDNSGIVVGSGIYFCRLVAQDQISTLKMMFMK